MFGLAWERVADIDVMDGCVWLPLDGRIESTNTTYSCAQVASDGWVLIDEEVSAYPRAVGHFGGGVGLYRVAVRVLSLWASGVWILSSVSLLIGHLVGRFPENVIPRGVGCKLDVVGCHVQLKSVFGG